MKGKFLCIAAIAAMIGFAVASCGDDDEKNGITTATGTVSVSLSDSSLVIESGSTATIDIAIKNAKSVEWTSSDESVAAITVFDDAHVEIKCQKVGSAIVSVTADDVTKSISVTVVKKSISYTTPKVIDLGLSVKWASSNIGASSPEEFGVYFAWGETETKDEYDWLTYAHSDGVVMTEYYPSNNMATLEASDDAATENLGENWRMPTQTEWEELSNNTTHAWTTDYNGTGVAGWILTSIVSGYTSAALFLPAAGYRSGTELSKVDYRGYYWSSSLDEDMLTLAIIAGFNSADFNVGNSSERCTGLSVRAVYIGE